MSNKARAYELLQAGNLTEARKYLEKICKKNKKDFESLMMLGYIYSQQGEHNKSIQCLLKVTHLTPGQDVAFYNLGNAYKARGDYQLAVDAFRKALKIKPGFEVCINLGNALASLSQYDEAVKYIKQAISMQPENADAHYNLARALKNEGLLEDSIVAYEKAIQIKPDFFAAYNNLGNACLSTGDIEKAADCYHKALSLQPDSLDALSGKLRLLDKTGEFEKAYELVQPHIDKKTEHAGLSATFADFSHYLKREQEAIEWMQVLTLSPDLPSADKSRLYFLLGKLFDKQHNFKVAFDNYEQANLLARLPLNLSRIKQYFASIQNNFNSHYFEKARTSTISSSRPVFIVGMPRSGTSLVEQIVASHPEVAAAGELETVSRFTQEAEGLINKNITYPKVISQLNSEQLNTMAEKYLQRLGKVSADAIYITDKMPHNFLHLGFIQLLFPDARIIHCRRDPIDTCLSCYFQDFVGNHPYSNDLSSLTEYYRLYENLMVHWQRHLSLPMLTIDYEQLIADQEVTSKKLIEFCRLDWHPDCLNFHQSRRVVSTASYDQVRQKIYSHSVERWRNYETFIQSLILDLGIKN